MIGCLSKLPEVKLCFTISGESDLFLLLDAPRLEDLAAVTDEIAGHPGVERCRSFIVLARKIDRRSEAGDLGGDEAGLIRRS